MPEERVHYYIATVRPIKTVYAVDFRSADALAIDAPSMLLIRYISGDGKPHSRCCQLSSAARVGLIMQIEHHSSSWRHSLPTTLS